MQISDFKNQIKSKAENSLIDECQSLINQVYPELSIRWAKIYGKRWAFIKGNQTGLSLNSEKYQLNPKLGIILDNPEVISEEQKKGLLALLKECFYDKS